MYTIQFPAGKLTAALVFAGKADIRYYLNGVLFTRAPDGKGVLAVSTDGHRLAAIYHRQEGAQLEQLPEAFQVIIPRGELETIAKQPIKAGREPMELLIQVDGDRITLRGAVTLECHAIDGKFPDWQKVIPRAPLQRDEEPGPCPSYGLNASYLGDYAKAHKALGGYGAPCIRLDQRIGGASQLITLAGMHEFVSVLMPMRENPPELPEWLTAPAPPALPAPEACAAAAA